MLVLGLIFGKEQHNVQHIGSLFLSFIQHTMFASRIGSIFQPFFETFPRFHFDVIVYFRYFTHVHFDPCSSGGEGLVRITLKCADG